MSGRLEDRTIIFNRHALYKRKLKDRGLKFFRHYGSPRFRNITDEEMDEIDTEERIWTAGDRLYKFAHEYYGDSTYWWIIAWFNERPTDSHFFPGDPIIIPTSLETMLSLFGERE